MEDTLLNYHVTHMNPDRKNDADSRDPTWPNNGHPEL